MYAGFLIGFNNDPAKKPTIDDLGASDLTKEDFEKTFGMDFNTSTQKTVNGYVDSLINKANEIKKTSDAVNSTFQNPFKNYVDPTPEQEKENFNYDTFESWKTDLTYFATIKDDVNQRLGSIQDNVTDVNALVTNDMLVTFNCVDLILKASA